MTLTGSSSNPALVANTNIVFGGSSSSRTVTITPKLNATGAAAITLTANDGADSGAIAFTLTVFDPNAVLLGLLPADAGLTLTWPGNIGQWLLYRATNLAPPTAWSPAAVTPVLSNQAMAGDPAHRDQFRFLLPPATQLNQPNHSTS